MGTFFELFKIKKTDLSESEQVQVVLDVHDEDLAFDTSLENPNVVELYKMQRHHAGPGILTQWAGKKDFGEVWNTCMFLSPDLFGEMIHALEAKDDWYDLKEQEKVLTDLREIQKSMDFENEFLFYTYF